MPGRDSVSSPCWAPRRERHPPTIREPSLSDLTGLAPASVTGILDRLERDGWVRRDRDPEDRRRVLVTLDQKAVAQKAAEPFRGLQRRLQELYERYTDGELELLLEALVEIARRQKEATFELVGDAGEEVRGE